MNRMEGKVALVTGAGSGIGRACAILMAKEGAKVVLTDIQLEKLEAVAEEIQSFNGEVFYKCHNVASESEWLSVIEDSVDKFGTVNVLVNSAGINSRGDSMEEWDRVTRINLRGSYMGMKYLIPVMQGNGGGSIINICSLAGITGGGFNGYAAAKGGIRAVSRAAAVDYAKDNIRVNSIYPGLIITPMTEAILQHDKMKQEFEQKTPLARFGTPEDIANGVVYLASDEASFVTGAELVIDGGTAAL
ncbi:hypothetical protein P40081_27965 [Paenibacillus sp. FSL P4-0081]|uniref:SDR family NAD(P)-dependent oxidoreductase n=1 Tax=unclassified Paenibacillus TaxID=185978 RepID=UPI0004F6A56A|nr:SDR family NAD(P)-dependent oxidoreductase [Paenibacillus sp. FSL P4-0081]AIQ31555.1 hypothetical protein P40081_27965 [Paenibacillus sp. FSL P4-0081]